MAQAGRSCCQYDCYDDLTHSHRILYREWRKRMHKNSVSTRGGAFYALMRELRIL
jgi:hypothetical protein